MKTTKQLAALMLGAAVVLGACGGGGGSGGKKLALGTEAVVAFTSPASGSTAAIDTSVGVTVLAVRAGTQQELTDGGMKVDDKDKDTTPYYVDARYANKGKDEVKRSFSVGMEDTDGNSIPTTLILTLTDEPFAPCKDVRDGTVAPGGSYESCTLFLVPKGAKLDRVRFVSQAPDAKITFTDWNVK